MREEDDDPSSFSQEEEDDVREEVLRIWTFLGWFAKNS